MSNVLQFPASKPHWTVEYAARLPEANILIERVFRKIYEDHKIKPSEFDPADIFLIREAIVAMLLRKDGHFHPVQDIATQVLAAIEEFEDDPS